MAERVALSTRGDWVCRELAPLLLTLLPLQPLQPPPTLLLAVFVSAKAKEGGREEGKDGGSWSVLLSLVA